MVARRFIPFSLWTFAVCAVVAVAYLGRIADSGDLDAGGPGKAHRATSVTSPVAMRIRRTIAWLDTVTTPKGAYVWPGAGDLCGLPR